MPQVSKATLPTTLKSTAMAVVDYLSKSMMCSAPLTNEIEDHVEDLLAPEIVLMFGAVD